MTASNSSDVVLSPTSTLGIVGAGRLGSTLALGLASAGYAVRAISSRSTASAQQLAQRLPNAQALDLDALCAHVDVLFLTTPDDTLQQLSAALPVRFGQVILTCSGALELSVLESARARGARVGCMHPLQTFPQRFDDARARFKDITVGIDGEPDVQEWLLSVCTHLGAHAVSLRGVNRARYHAAAVLASNYVIALQQAAAEAWTLAGLPHDLARHALAPLTRGAADAVHAAPLERALTGPVARGDVATVEKHLAALAVAPELLALYRALGARLLALDLPLHPEAQEKLAALLGAPHENSAK